MREDLDVAGRRVREPPLEADPALLRELQPRLRLQHVDGNAGAALHPLVLQIELPHDRPLAIAGKRHQPTLSQHLDIGVDPLEQHVLPHAFEGEPGHLQVEPRRAHLRGSGKAVEHVLREPRAGDLGNRSPGAAALALQHRAVDVLRPGLAEDVELRQVAGIGHPDALLGGRDRLLPGANIRVAREQVFQFRVQRSSKQRADFADSEHRRHGQREQARRAQ